MNGETTSAGHAAGGRSAGFTLVEMVVVVAIVGVLIATLAPALGRARAAAKTARELCAGQQLMLAYALYADDNKECVLPGYPPEAWVDNGSLPSPVQLTVVDVGGRPVTSTQARRYPWRIAPYMDFNFAGLYEDERILKGYASLGADEYQYLVSLSPSFGLNQVFVGGDSDRGGFSRATLAAYGQFYLTRLDQARRPAQLLVFTSSKGPGLDGDTTEGYFRVDAPSLRVRQWSVPATWMDAQAMPAGYGFVSYRLGGRSGVLNLDGHAQLLGYSELDDMRRWADGATGPAWTIDQN